jgi:hypothetical protein
LNLEREKKNIVVVIGSTGVYLVVEKVIKARVKTPLHQWVHPGF